MNKTVVIYYNKERTSKQITSPNEDFEGNKPNITETERKYLYHKLVLGITNGRYYSYELI